MDLIEVLNNSVPNAGPKTKASVAALERRLAILSQTEPDRAAQFRQQAAQQIASRDPSIGDTIADVGRMYGSSLSRAAPPREGVKPAGEAPEQATANRLAAVAGQLSALQTQGVIIPRELSESVMNMSSDSKPPEISPMALAGIESMVEQLAKGRPQKDALMKQYDDLEGIISLTRKIYDPREKKSHPGLESSVGRKGAAYLFGLKNEPLAGTKSSDFESLMKMLEGKGFLTAFQELKGGGPITDIEGQKATAAKFNLNTDQTEDQFKRSMREIIEEAKKKQKEIEGVLSTGMPTELGAEGSKSPAGNQQQGTLDRNSFFKNLPR